MPVVVVGDGVEAPGIQLPADMRVASRMLAQAVHQQASYLVKQIPAKIDGRPLIPFKYRDFGSLVSLGEYSTVGSLMGFIQGRNMFIAGLFARLMYRSLYKMHQRALHGTVKTALDALARALTRRTEPRIKLH